MKEKAIKIFKAVQKSFKDFILIEREINGGGQIILQFDNGWGASVIHHNFSYGNESGLCELAVFDFDGELSYETPITDDVLGCLNLDDVINTLIKIKGLPVNV